MQFKDSVMLFQKIINIFSMNGSALQMFKQSQEVYKPRSFKVRKRSNHLEDKTN